jgi:hypothetical protein
VFLNGSLSGLLVLRRHEVVPFETILARGCVPGLDTLETSGDTIV